MRNRGSRFFGFFVLEKLKERGAGEIFVPHFEKYNLVDPLDVERVLDDARPDVIIHLAAHVGGIGANRLHPAEFFTII